MSTSLSDKPLSHEISSPPDMLSSTAYRAPRNANSRKPSSGDESCSDDEDRHDPVDRTTAAPLEDVRHFEEAMSSSGQRSENSGLSVFTRQKSESRERDKDTDDEQKDSADMSIASLFAGRFGAGGVSPTVKAEAPVAAEPMPESIAERLAERILVSESSVAGQEVRIQPSRDILPDTEICLVRGPDGRLTAVIHTDNPNSFQTLAAAQHDLRQRLEDSEGQSVHVELRSSADDGDPDRRSRGLVQYPDHE